MLILWIILLLGYIYQKGEQGYYHQKSVMPSVLEPEKVKLHVLELLSFHAVAAVALNSYFLQLPSLEELRERRLTDPSLPKYVKHTHLFHFFLGPIGC